MIPCIHLTLQSWVQGSATCPQLSYGSEKSWIFSLLSFLPVLRTEFLLPKSLYVEPETRSSSIIISIFFFFNVQDSVYWIKCSVFLLCFSFRSICYVLKEAYGNILLILYIKLSVLCNSNNNLSDTLVHTS